jgi:hypothetical protein
MTFRSTRSARLLPAALALLCGQALIPHHAVCQSLSQADDPTHPPFMPEAKPVTRPPLPAIPMPQDRAAESYSIYSQLLPVGALGNPGWPRAMLLLSDTTVSLVPPDEPCLASDAGLSGNSMNPHIAVRAPDEMKQDLDEMLEDFDHRCHERILLTFDAFKLVVPLHLLSPDEQDEFVSTRFDQNAGHEGDRIAARYKGAPGLSSFSQVYFNAHHTRAMVYATGWCGGLCVQSFWVVMEFENGQWKRLTWDTASEMS